MYSLAAHDSVDVPLSRVSLRGDGSDRDGVQSASGQE